MILMCNLLEQSSNYSETSGRLLFYSKHEATRFNNNIENMHNCVKLNY